MISGVGVDLVEIQRIDALLRRYGERFARRVLCQLELDLFKLSSRPARFVASCFAAKEAFAKALGTGLRHPVTLRAIRVDRDALGKPVLQFHHDLEQWLADRGVGGAHLSLTDEAGMACAMVVLEKR